jgi:hypothetical protein
LKKNVGKKTLTSLPLGMGSVEHGFKTSPPPDPDRRKFIREDKKAEKNESTVNMVTSRQMLNRLVIST